MSKTKKQPKQPKERDWVEEVGAPAYATIAEMVAALQADRDRLEELRDELEALEDEVDAIAHSADQDEDCDAKKVALIEWKEENGEELAELVAAVTLDGDEVDEDQARERIQEDPLSLRIFGERTDGEWEADRYELLLATSGPAVRIVGDLNGGEASSARLEVQDWYKPWTEYLAADDDVLMAYVGCFCFE